MIVACMLRSLFSVKLPLKFTRALGRSNMPVFTVREVWVSNPGYMNEEAEHCIPSWLPSITLKLSSLCFHLEPGLGLFKCQFPFQNICLSNDSRAPFSISYFYYAIHLFEYPNIGKVAYTNWVKLSHGLVGWIIW